MFGTTKGRELLAEGERLLGLAFSTAESEGASAAASDAISAAIRILRSAMNWLEDTDDFETAHQKLDQAGFFRRTHFPAQCTLSLGERGYSVTCPVSLAHNRVGLSPGYIVRSAECSICRLDPEDCTHNLGRAYCGEVCYRIITRADLLEISLVGRPAHPDARIESIGVGDAELREQLGPTFRRGMSVRCDRCLTPCDGVERQFEVRAHGVPI